MSRIDVSVDHDLCMSSGECVFHLPAVFDLDEATGQAVVRLDAAQAAGTDDLVRTARLCPNFAIRVVVDGEILT